MIKKMALALAITSLISVNAYAVDTVNTGDVVIEQGTNAEVIVPDISKFTGISHETPADWAAPQIYSAMNYSDLFILDWENKYKDNLTRGQFGILVDAALYSKVETYPEYAELAEMATMKLYGCTVDDIKTEIKTNKENIAKNITNAKWAYLDAVDKELDYKANAVGALAKLYTNDTWLEAYSNALSNARTQHFTDTDAIIKQYCEILYHCEITKGTSDTTFEPNRPITRQEAAVMINNMMNFLGIKTELRTEKFNDDDKISSWASDAVYRVTLLKQANSDTSIMAGIGGNLFDPLSNITIEQAICVIYRLTTIM